MAKVQSVRVETTLHPLIITSWANWPTGPRAVDW